GQALHGALEIGEKHGDLLPLAFESALRGEDLLGEMLGGVGVRSPESWRGGGLGRRMGALGAEFCRRRKLRAAVGAGAHQRRGALFAELRLRPIIVLAAETLHPGPPGGPRRTASERVPGSLVRATSTVKDACEDLMIFWLGHGR